MFLPAILNNCPFAHLKEIHLSSYAVTISALASLFSTLAHGDSVLHLADLVVLRSIPNRVQSSDESESALWLTDYWIQLLQDARDHHPEYVSSGRIKFEGIWRCIGIPEGQDLTEWPLWEETLNQSCVDVLERFMRTGSGISEVRRVMECEGQQQYQERTEYQYEILPEHERWQ